MPIFMFRRYLLECPGDQPGDFREAQVLLHLVEEIKDMEAKDKILGHPLISTFATLKYQKYQFVSIMLLVYHVRYCKQFLHSAIKLNLAHLTQKITLFLAAIVCDPFHQLCLSCVSR